MALPEKVCPVVYRRLEGALDILAFRHPLAGNPFVKGTVGLGELPIEAALRELREESGISTMLRPRRVEEVSVGSPPIVWHLYAIESGGLPRNWDHQTEDDRGHVFSFFWHPLTVNLDEKWHPMFHEVFVAVRSALLGGGL